MPLMSFGMAKIANLDVTTATGLLLCGARQGAPVKEQPARVHM